MNPWISWACSCLQFLKLGPRRGWFTETRDYRNSVIFDDFKWSQVKKKHCNTEWAGPKINYDASSWCESTGITLVYTLYKHDCSLPSQTNHIFKFVDDTTVLHLISTKRQVCLWERSGYIGSLALWPQPLSEHQQNKRKNCRFPEVRSPTLAARM